MIRSLSKIIINLLGLDSTVAYTIGAKIMQSIGGVFTLVLVARYLNIQEQGYYYTFGSILALQIFFELGLSGIICQFAAHEVPHLEINKLEQYGKNQHLNRLSSLLHFSFKWFSVTSLFVFIILSLSGYIFFTHYNGANMLVEWRYPWFLLVFTSSINLLTAPILSFFAGIGKIKDVVTLRFYQQLCIIIFVWGSLICGLKLYATGVSTLVTFTIALVWITRSKQKKTLSDIWKALDINGKIISWEKEIFPYQWRIALSWIAGYLSFQIFNPVLFATEGATMAGKMGMSLTVFNGVTGLAMGWITTKIPVMSGYISTQNYSMLDVLFKKTFKQGLFVSASCVCIFLMGIKTLDLLEIPFLDRFLEFKYLVLLSIITITNIMVFFWAAYIRCFKKEPFLMMSLAMGSMTLLSTIANGYIFGIGGIIIGYTALSLFMYLPWAYKIYTSKKKQWCVKE